MSAKSNACRILKGEDDQEKCGSWKVHDLSFLTTLQEEALTIRSRQIVLEINRGCPVSTMVEAPEPTKSPSGCWPHVKNTWDRTRRSAKMVITGQVSARLAGNVPSGRFCPPLRRPLHTPIVFIELLLNS
ncbi:unnamed protein product [Heligmosomoides polygyrus]|uniref:Uncharacterized protein n=1 Tax=Heligmosomoides polygyrus TaxID=6339 RepID=A0A183GE78_HELPZ|nr:unnamed protein product [Heligmosomoides polygyrus]